MIGSVLGNRYELLEKIGEGGMAIVYKAKCRLLNRMVAVKVLKAEFQEDAEFLRRFGTEAQAAASLSHSNVVSVYDVGTHGKLNYIVMEYVEGITLKEYMSRKEECLSVSEATDFSMQIASALEHAHSKKIIHRDIKPQNIVITNTGVLKVMDFGLARAVSSATTFAGNSEALGSVHYASPEQARGGFTDERSDIYSLGIVMYEMFTGELPFDGETPIAVAMKHLQRAPVPPRTKNENISVPIENVILRAMQKEARERYPDVTALIADIKDAARTEAHTKSMQTDKFSTRRLPVINQDELEAEEEKMPVKPVVTDKKKKEDRIAVIAAAITSVIIVVVLGFFIARLFYMGDGTTVDGSVVPNLEGQNYEEVLEKYGDLFTITEEQRIPDKEIEEGYIISQTPKAGERADKNTVIGVIISLGSESKLLPDFSNKDYRRAQDEIKRMELNLSCEVIEESSDELETGKVIRQEPAAGTDINRGEKIILYVSKGKSNIEVEMPKITGYSEERAREILEANGLTVGTVKAEKSSQPKGTVISQSVDAGNMVSSETAINFTVSTGADESGDKVKRKIALSLPADKETVNVKIISGEGTMLYNAQHDAMGATVTVEVEGKGRQTLEIFYDGVLDHSMNVSF